MKVICVIPARYGSTRFPGKPLVDIKGKPLIQWVYEKAEACKKIEAVYVATDDKRIFDAVQGFGGNALMTTSDYQSGTDRIADAVKGLSCDAVVNLQGDEPMMHPDTLDRTIELLQGDPRCAVATAMVKIKEKKEYLSPNAVKVVTTPEGKVLYFSRSPIPSRARIAPGGNFDRYFGFKHLGLYVFRKDVLLAFPKMKPSFLERLEQLEQLRFLENGYLIKAIETPHDSIGIDTPEDLQRLLDHLNLLEEK